MAHRKRPSSTRSSAAIVGDNDDLLMEILFFLPAKSIIRLKVVSKHWSLLISDPSFCRNHAFRHRHEPQASLLLLLDESSSQYHVCSAAVKRLVPCHFGFTYVKILQSSNGLLLLECKKYIYGRKDYYIFNPTTMQCRDLYLGESFDELLLIYDPAKSYHYKVFLFRSSFPFLLYDSETHTWKENNCESQFELYKCSNGIICLDDSISFIKSVRLFRNGKIFPISPPISWSRANKSYILKSNKNLYCVVLSLEGQHNWLFIFEYIGECLNEISFSLKHSVDLNPIWTTFFEKNFNIGMLGQIRGERGEGTILLFHVPGKIVIYRCRYKTWEVLVNFRIEYDIRKAQLQFGFKDAHPFIESLAPV